MRYDSGWNQGAFREGRARWSDIDRHDRYRASAQGGGVRDDDDGPRILELCLKKASPRTPPPQPGATRQQVVIASPMGKKLHLLLNPTVGLDYDRHRLALWWVGGDCVVVFHSELDVPLQIDLCCPFLLNLIGASGIRAGSSWPEANPSTIPSVERGLSRGLARAGSTRQQVGLTSYD